MNSVGGNFSNYRRRKSLISEESEITLTDMEINAEQTETVGDEEEYVLLDLDGVRGKVDIPSNAPYVLSGLDTLNPILVIGDNLKLIGEYVETIGTCYVFTETDGDPVVHEETGPSEANLFRGKCIIDPIQTSGKQVRHMASLHKVLKFKLFSEGDKQAVAADSN